MNCQIGWTPRPVAEPPFGVRLGGEILRSETLSGSGDGITRSLHRAALGVREHPSSPVLFNHAAQISERTSGYLTRASLTVSQQMTE